MSFTFKSNEAIPLGTHVLVPSGITTKQALMDILASVLDLPDYFGKNWDALEECIRDLSWMPPGSVVLIHEDLPLRNDKKGLGTYLFILRDAVAKWKEKEKEGRSLVVVFPSSVEQEVQTLLS